MMKDGHLNKCIECTKKDTATSKAANKHYYREYDRKRGKLSHRITANKKYMQSEAGKAAHLRANQKYRQSNKTKYACHIITNNALRDGIITKKPCKKCGDKKVQAHHKNYFEPLKITWLCRACHAQEHHKHKKDYQYLKS